MTLRTRLILTIGGVALLLVLPALYAAYHLSELRQIAANVSHTHGAAYVAMGRLQGRLAEANRLERSYVAVPDAETATQRDTALARAGLNVARLRQAGYGELADSADARLSALHLEIAAIDDLVATGESQAATDRLPAASLIFTQADTLVSRIGAEIDRRSEGDLRSAFNISAAALTTTLLALVACIFIALLLGTWATHTVVQPITRLGRSMAAVSAGEFVVPGWLPYERSDEIGDLARSFASMTQQLAALDRMKADFMSVATHELKTPINVISGYAELIQEGVYGNVSPEQRDALKSIQEQSRMLTQLVNQLLDISRLEAGGLKLEIGELTLTDLFERIRRTFEVLARKQGIDLNVELDPRAPSTIPADGDRLRDQVLGNLLGNALKFTPEGGRIDVRGRSDNGHFRIEVADTGSGMPADQLPHVFDKYYQIGEQARSKGAGLGLAIAHEIVHAHGGTISVESQEGSGTTFRIDLPITRKQMEAARRAQAARDDD
jgi:signal transduction histidine kinase